MGHFLVPGRVIKLGKIAIQYSPVCHSHHNHQDDKKDMHVFAIYKYILLMLSSFFSTELMNPENHWRSSSHFPRLIISTRVLVSLSQ